MICPKRTKSTAAGKKVDCTHYIRANEKGFCRLRDEFLCIEDLERGLPTISFSSAGDWCTCHMLYFLKHVKGIKILDTAKGPALKMGALWDVCVQVLLKEAPLSDIKKTIINFEIEEVQVAKVRALYRAWKDLGINIDSFCKVQKRFEIPLHYDLLSPPVDFVISGIYDRVYDDYFVETKLSGSPDWYLTLYNLVPQVGTYFLADPAMLYVIMEICRTPALKSVGKFKDESPKQYEERCYNDIMERPAFYFIGWDKERKVFGKKFFRAEFPLEEIRTRFSNIHFEIAEAAHRTPEGAFWKNWKACYSPWVCDMLNVCHHNTVSESIYKMSKKPLEVEKETIEIFEREEQ